MTHFSQLSDELFILIAKQLELNDLYTCTLINHQFYRTMNPTLWHTIDIYTQNFFTSFVASLLTSPQKLGQHVRFVSIYVPMSDSHLLLLTKHFPLLTKLKLLENSMITDQGIDHLTSYCPHLNSLYITNDPINSELTRRSIQLIGERLTDLYSFYLTGRSGINPLGGTFSALKTCPLRKLLLSVGDLASINNVAPAAELVLDLLCLNRLENLILVDCPGHFSQLLFSIKANKERANSHGTTDGYWPRLVDFCLGSCGGVDEAAMLYFIKNQSSLTHLSITGGQFTDTVVNAISSCLPWIKMVNLSHNRNISARQIRRMINNCDHLGMVVLDGCQIPVDGFPEVGEDCWAPMEDRDEYDSDFEDDFGFGPPLRYMLRLYSKDIINIQKADKVGQRQQQQQQQQKK